MRIAIKTDSRVAYLAAKYPGDAAERWYGQVTRIITEPGGVDISRRIPIDQAAKLAAARPGDRVEVDVFLEDRGRKFIACGPGGEREVARGAFSASVAAIEYAEGAA